MYNVPVDVMMCAQIASPAVPISGAFGQTATSDQAANVGPPQSSAEPRISPNVSIAPTTALVDDAATKPMTSHAFKPVSNMSRCDASSDSSVTTDTAQTEDAAEIASQSLHPNASDSLHPNASDSLHPNASQSLFLNAKEFDISDISPQRSRSCSIPRDVEELKERLRLNPMRSRSLDDSKLVFDESLEKIYRNLKASPPSVELPELAARWKELYPAAAEMPGIETIGCSSATVHDQNKLGAAAAAAAAAARVEDDSSDSDPDTGHVYPDVEVVSYGWHSASASLEQSLTTSGRRATADDTQVRKQVNFTPVVAPVQNTSTDSGTHWMRTQRESGNKDQAARHDDAQSPASSNTKRSQPPLASSLPFTKSYVELHSLLMRLMHTVGNFCDTIYSLPRSSSTSRDSLPHLRAVVAARCKYQEYLIGVRLVFQFVSIDVTNILYC